MARLDSYARNRIIGSVIILALIIVAFLFFVETNEAHVVETNGVYAENITKQTANRIDDLMASAQYSIGTAARILQGATTEGELNDENMRRIGNGSMFSNIAYCNAEGSATGFGGRVFDATRQEFYIRGLQGMNGICAYSPSQTGEGSIVIAYAPVYDNDYRVEGVLLGVFDDQRLMDMLQESFQDTQLNVFLCESDGDIIAHADTFSRTYANAQEIYATNETNTDFVNTVAHSFETLSDASFTYHGSAGTGNAYITKLPNYDWMLLLMFPSSISAGILSQINSSGFALIATIVIAFIAFIVLLIVQGRRESKKLRMEKLELGRMMDAVTNLYRRFIYIDLENDTYEYLKNDVPEDDIPMKGKFSEYAAYWKDRIDDGPDSPGGMGYLLDIANIRKELGDGRQFAQHEYMVEIKGKKRWMQGSALAIRREVDEVETLLLAIQDINDMKEREEQSHIALQEAYNAAEQASKAKSDFLNSMSHDIRTPMNSIMGLTAIATMYIDDKERVKDCLSKITISSRHLLGLINEVLDMAKIESGNISLSEEDFDLPEAVENLLTIINPQVDAKHQELKIDIANIKHEHVIGDPMRLQQVFVNIMGNSVKFTPEGGTIGLAIRELPSHIPGSGRFEFKFSDTGCGMSEEFVKRVFEPFARANDSRVTKVEGTGLGMAIVKSVVNLMNGTIDVKSKLGEGTTFTIDVYLKLRDVEHADVSELRGMRILVADDDETACESTVALLAEIGMMAEYVLSGEEAVQRVKIHHETENDYVAVILDWRMPGMSGVEAAKEIRQLVGNDLPIIILSAYDWTAIEQEARATGVDAFISKPLFRSRLVHVLTSVLIQNDEEVASDLDDLQNQDFSGYRILLVEDNALAADIAQDILGITKVEVDHAENGKVAVEMVTEKPENYYDLILMDVQMPIMNGYEATKAIRETGRPDLQEIPIIALTADAFNDDVLKAKNAGMNAHMSKPMEISALISTLNQWL